MRLFYCYCVAFVCLLLQFPAWAASPLSSSLQAVVVVAKDMDTPYGEMQRYSRQRPNARWEKTGHTCRVELGKNGLAWGRGIIPIEPAKNAFPIKQEGDGRSPAGVFFLGHILATPEGRADIAFRHDVETITPRHLCVEDPTSPYYNRLINRAIVNAPELDDVHSTLLSSGLFTYAIYVGHNQPHPVPGAGSCVYLHLKRSDGDATAGCSALYAKDMMTLLRWLKPEDKPILIQIPDSAAAITARKTGLPLASK